MASAPGSPSYEKSGRPTADEYRLLTEKHQWDGALVNPGNSRSRVVSETRVLANHTLDPTSGGTSGTSVVLPSSEVRVQEPVLKGRISCGQIAYGVAAAAVFIVGRIFANSLDKGR